MKKNKLNLTIVFILTFIILIFVLKDDFPEIIESLANVKFMLLFLALLVILLANVIKGFAFYLAVKKENKSYSYSDALKIILVSNCLNRNTLFASGSKPYQVYYLNKNNDIHYLKGIGIAFYNFYLYQLSLLIFSTTIIFINSIFKVFTLTPILIKLVVLGYSINFIIAVFASIIYYEKRKEKRLTTKLLSFLNKIKIIKDRPYRKFRKRLNDIHNSIETLKKDNKFLYKGYSLNILFFIVYYSVPVFVFYSLGYTELSIILSIMLYIHVVMVSSFVPIPGGTIGFEVGFLTFFGLFIIGPILKAGMLLWRFLTYHLLMIIGFIVFLIKKKE